MGVMQPLLETSGHWEANLSLLEEREAIQSIKPDLLLLVMHPMVALVVAGVSGMLVLAAVDIAAARVVLQAAKAGEEGVHMTSTGLQLCTPPGILLHWVQVQRDTMQAIILAMVLWSSISSRLLAPLS